MNMIWWFQVPSSSANERETLECKDDQLTMDKRAVYKLLQHMSSSLLCLYQIYMYYRSNSDKLYYCTKSNHLSRPYMIPRFMFVLDWSNFICFHCSIVDILTYSGRYMLKCMWTGDKWHSLIHRSIHRSIHQLVHPSVRFTSDPSKWKMTSVHSSSLLWPENDRMLDDPFDRSGSSSTYSFSGTLDSFLSM